MKAVFDVRIEVNRCDKEFEEMVAEWCKKCGEGITYEFAPKHERVIPTLLDDSCIFWKAFKNVTDKLDMKLVKKISCGVTDMQFLRAVKIELFVKIFVLIKVKISN